MGALLKRYAFSTLLVIAAAGYAYYYYEQHQPCVRPIGYKIGSVDSRFGVSEAQFIEDIKQASSIWSDSIGKPLFIYDPKGPLTMSLVYDTRQQTTQQEKKLKTVIDQTTETASSAKAEYQAAQAKYVAAKGAYADQLAQYTAAQDAYNARVVAFNRSSGTSQTELAALQSQKQSLQSQQNTLEVKRGQVNALAARANSLVESYNALVDTVNTHVETFNSDGLAGTQFEEGVYISDEQGRRIDIYQFDSQTTFIRVLAHELGHALGLDHDAGVESIMNPVNEGKNLSLSEADLQELRGACNIQ